jgi:hypothetical protein
MGFRLGLLNGFEIGLNVEYGNGALSIRIGLNGLKLLFMTRG